MIVQGRSALKTVISKCWVQHHPTRPSLSSSIVRTIQYILFLSCSQFLSNYWYSYGFLFWFAHMESEGFRLSGTKTEYMRCCFNTTRHEEEEEVSLDGQVVPQRTPFDIWGQCYKGMGISMKMWTIESKPDGWSGTKLLAFFVTRECHKS